MPQSSIARRDPGQVHGKVARQSGAQLTAMHRPLAHLSAVGTKSPTEALDGLSPQANRFIDEFYLAAAAHVTEFSRQSLRVGFGSEQHQERSNRDTVTKVQSSIVASGPAALRLVPIEN